MRTAEELACETTEVTQGTGAVTSTATAAVRRVLVAAEQSVHSHTPDTPISRRPVNTACSVGHDGLHGAISMAHRLRPVRVGDELRLLLGSAVGVLDLRRRSVARLGRLSGDLPLRNSGRELDIVVLLARTIPLSNPAGG